MSAVAFVEQSRAWARDLVNADVRGPGDLDNAMRRVEARWGIPFAALWSPRYRPPKDVGASVYARLYEAHAAMCAAQKRKYEDELERTKATAGLAAAFARAAVAVAGESHQPGAAED